MIKEESDDDIFQESQIDEEEGNKNLQYQPNIKKEEVYCDVKEKTEPINNIDINVKDLGNDTEFLKKRESFNSLDEDEDLFVS